MKQLPPLIESSESVHGRKLLHAARADGPSRGAAGRALAALGVTSAATVAASAAAASTATASTSSAVSLPLLAAKWLVVGALGGGLLASGASFVLSTPPAKPLQAESSPVASAAVGTRTGREGEPRAATAEVEEAQPRVVAKTPRPSGSTPGNKLQPAAEPFAAPSQAAFAGPEQSKLLRDVALLDAARRSLRENDSARALQLLTRFDAERETHVLDREAQLLRIDVLLARGQRDAARTLAGRYVAAFPGDAHAERLRALVGEEKAR